MTTEPDPITERIPAAAASTRAPRTKRRTKRHPAAASRILAAGLATASTFGLVAVVGNRAQAGESQAAEAASAVVDTTTSLAPTTVAPTTAPPPVVVIRRTYVQVDGGIAPATSSSGASGRSATSSPAPAAAPQRSAPVTAAPRRTAPATTSSSS